MRRIYLFLSILLMTMELYALPVGNPADPLLLKRGLLWERECDLCAMPWYSALSFRAGFYGDYVYNKHMEVVEPHDDVIENTQIFTNAGFLTVNFCNRWDLFATLGATNLFIETNGATFNIITTLGNTGVRCIIETTTAFSWSLGVRGALWKWGCATLGFEAQYFRTNPAIRLISSRSSQIRYVSDTLSAKYQEWQLGLGLSYRIRSLVPYVAVKWNGTRVGFGNPTFSGGNFEGAQLYNLQNKDSWGYAVGATLIACDMMSLTVEGRFVEERAFYLNGQIRF